jgi:DNA primase
MHVKDFIEANVAIDEVVRHFVILWESMDGTFKTAHCPFHIDENKALIVNTSERSFYCFACKAAGDMFDFVSRLKKVDFLGACEIICAALNIPLPDTDKNGKMSDAPIGMGTEVPPLLHLAVRKYCKEQKIHLYTYQLRLIEDNMRSLGRYK